MKNFWFSLRTVGLAAFMLAVLGLLFSALGCTPQVPVDEQGQPIEATAPYTYGHLTCYSAGTVIYDEDVDSAELVTMTYYNDPLTPAYWKVRAEGQSLTITGDCVFVR